MTCYISHFRHNFVKRIHFYNFSLFLLFLGEKLGVINFPKVSQSLKKMFHTSVITNSSLIPSCFNFSSFPPNKRVVVVDNLEKILIMDFLRIDQKFSNMVLEKYPRLRDMHSEPPFHGPFVHIMNIVTSALNMTFIMKMNILPQCLDNSGNPIFPTMIMSTLGRDMLQTFKSNIYPVHSLLTHAIELNFCYCSQPVNVLEGTSPITLFQNTGDTWFWISLGVSLFLVSFLLRLSHSVNFGSICLSTLSALICSGISVHSRSLLRYSWLFILWTVIGLNVATYFTCTFTSRIIITPAEWRMTKLEQLIERNFSLINSSPTIITIIRRIVLNTIPSAGNKQRALRIIQLKEMFKQAWAPDSLEMFLEVMASSGKYATVTTAADAIFSATRIKRYMTKNKVTPERKCYIGQKTAIPNNIYTLFIANNSEKMSRILQYFIDSGIYIRWYKEVVYIGQSDKVQRRSQIVSLTKIKPDTVKFKPLQLRGKLGNVFLLWFLLLTVCFIVGILEWGCGNFALVSKIFRRGLRKFQEVILPLTCYLSIAKLKVFCRKSLKN